MKRYLGSAILGQRSDRVKQNQPADGCRGEADQLLMSVDRGQNREQKRR